MLGLVHRCWIRPGYSIDLCQQSAESNCPTGIKLSQARQGCNRPGVRRALEPSLGGPLDPRKTSRIAPLDIGSRPETFATAATIPSPASFYCPRRPLAGGCALANRWASLLLGQPKRKQERKKKGKLGTKLSDSLHDSFFFSFSSSGFWLLWALVETDSVQSNIVPAGDTDGPEMLEEGRHSLTSVRQPCVAPPQHPSSPVLSMVTLASPAYSTAPSRQLVTCPF